MKIKAFAKQFAMSEDTIRYYEKIGLMQPERLANGYRHYGEQQAAQLKMIIVLKQLGFTLAEMKQLLTLEQQEISKQCNEAAVALFAQKIATLTMQVTFYEQAIATLQQTKELMANERYAEHQQDIAQAIDELFATMKGGHDHG